MKSNKISIRKSNKTSSSIKKSKKTSTRKKRKTPTRKSNKTSTRKSNKTSSSTRKKRKTSTRKSKKKSSRKNKKLPRLIKWRLSNSNSNLEKTIKNDSNICKFNIENPTKIIHILSSLESPLNTERLSKSWIMYIPIKIDQLSRELINTKCDSNILIIASSKIKNVSTKLNKFISNLDKENISFQNITIYHETKDTNNMVYKNNNFKKIINIFSSGLFINYIFPDNIKFNFTYDIETKYNSKYFSASIQLRDTLSISNRVDLQWWFKLYFSIPPCATGRFVQFTGTCWFNTAFNTLILTPKIAGLLKNYYHMQDDETKKNIEQFTFESCPTLNMNLKSILQIIIYNILIKGTKAKFTHGNFIGHLAARTKSLSETGSEEYYNNLKLKDLKEAENYGEGYWEEKALFVMMNILFTNKEDFYYFNYDDMIKETNNKITSLYNRINFMKDLNKNGIMDKKIESIENEINNLKTPKFIDVFEKLTSNNIIRLSSEDLNIKKLPLILVFSKQFEFKNLAQFIEINGIRYNLEAAGITLEKPNQSGHAISGLKCNDKYYIYDSNNIISDDDWSFGNLQNYSILNKDFNQYNNYNFSYLIYILSEPIKN